MIKAIYILNTAGKVRLVRVFDESVSTYINLKNTKAMTNSEEVVQELTAKVAARKDHYCNFIDDCQSVIKPHKVVYRYNGLSTKTLIEFMRL